MVEYSSCREAAYYEMASGKDLEKKFKKVLKKVLTRRNDCGIIVKLSARNGERSLKIEQQERSTKHSMCENFISSKSYIYSTKVKEAKKK